ncbi:hypothetical protein [Candidatus Thiosymbion oneisti]|uniref:hypothetical protein n=1 Tax=Candidatus Thiosymbion oneisti TaxID=589554 RepID=UPI00105FCAB6|nr:hypothetical protein [Candidatus Thiosymbion oneisti]
MNRLKILGKGILGALLGMTVGTASAGEPYATPSQCALNSVSAKLARAVGKILVNQGAGYIRGKVGRKLERGARVMAMEGSKATIKFDDKDKCNYTLKDDEVLTITDVSPCAKRATLERIDGDDDAKISRRSRIKTGRIGERLRRGDQVAVPKGHKAIIRFDDGCEHTLEDDEILTVGDVSTCCTLKDTFRSHSVASQNPVPDLTLARAHRGGVQARHAITGPGHLYTAPTVAAPGVATTTSWWSWLPGWGVGLSAGWFIPIIAIAVIAVPIVDTATGGTDNPPLSP